MGVCCVVLFDVDLCIVLFVFWLIGIVGLLLLRVWFAGYLVFSWGVVVVWLWFMCRLRLLVVLVFIFVVVLIVCELL